MFEARNIKYVFYGSRLRRDSTYVHRSILHPECWVLSSRETARFTLAYGAGIVFLEVKRKDKEWASSILLP